MSADGGSRRNSTASGGGGGGGSRRNSIASVASSKHSERLNTNDSRGHMLAKFDANKRGLTLADNFSLPFASPRCTQAMLETGIEIGMLLPRDRGSFSRDTSNARVAQRRFEHHEGQRQRNCDLLLERRAQLLARSEVGLVEVRGEFVPANEVGNPPAAPVSGSLQRQQDALANQIVATTKRVEQNVLKELEGERVRRDQEEKAQEAMRALEQLKADKMREIQRRKKNANDETVLRHRRKEARIEQEDVDSTMNEYKRVDAEVRFEKGRKERAAVFKEQSERFMMAHEEKAAKIRQMFVEKERRVATVANETQAKIERAEAVRTEAVAAQKEKVRKRAVAAAKKLAKAQAIYREEQAEKHAKFIEATIARDEATDLRIKQFLEDKEKEKKRRQEVSAKAEWERKQKFDRMQRAKVEDESSGADMTELKQQQLERALARKHELQQTRTNEAQLKFSEKCETAKRLNRAKDFKRIIALQEIKRKDHHSKVVKQQKEQINNSRRALSQSFQMKKKKMMPMGAVMDATVRDQKILEATLDRFGSTAAVRFAPRPNATGPITCPW